MGAPEIKRRRRAALATLTVRLAPNVTLEVRSDGELAACFYGHSVNLGKFSIGAVSCVQTLLIGLPFSSLSSGSGNLDKEIQLLTQRLATHGLLEYRLGLSRKGDDLVVIEPQLPDYWPQTPLLHDTDTLALSRFAYMRRRGNEMVLEIASRWCVVQNLQSEDCDRLGPTFYTAPHQTTPSEEQFSRR